MVWSNSKLSVVKVAKKLSCKCYFTNKITEFNSISRSIAAANGKTKNLITILKLFNDPTCLRPNFANYRFPNTMEIDSIVMLIAVWRIVEVYC